MGDRGGRVRKDSYKGYDARDFVNIKNYDTNNMMYLNGVESEKIKSEEIISKVVSMVEKKAKEIEEKN